MTTSDDARIDSTAGSTADSLSTRFDWPAQGDLLHSPLSPSGIAHDINNLLLVIQNTMESVWADPRSLAERKAAGVIHLAIAKARSLAHGIMGNESRRPPQKPVASAPDRLVNAFRPLLQGIVSGKARLHFKLAKNAPPIKVDHDGFGEILLNLVKNASEALNGQKGEITVEVAALEMTEGQRQTFGLFGCTPAPGPGTVISVRDNGPGMDPDLLDRSAKPRFTTKVDGHGIGLSNVIALVKASDGGICIRTSPRKGFSFNFWIPATQDPVVEEPEVLVQIPDVVRPATQGRRLRVLMLDDDPAILQSSAILLTSLNVEPILANTQNDAYQLFLKNHATIDLVFLDANVDQMSSLPLLERFRKISPATPCVIVSGYAEARIKCIFKAELYDAFLGKPYTRADMQGILERFAKNTAEPEEA
ncbi:MAG: ATP-binding protein [Kiritimatiellia bacterium]|jgi:CheY-like chemotaxis protein